MAEEILRKLLREIVKDLEFVDCALRIDPVFSSGANYTSSLYNVTVTEGERIVHMFAKVALTGESLRLHAPRVFETEKYAYTKLLKVYERLEKDHEVPQEHRLTFSKFYGYNPNKFEEVIVLENLVMSGYESFDRVKSIDWEYAKSAVNSLAKMHALGFAYGEYYPEQCNKVFEDFNFKIDLNSDYMSSYFKSTVILALKATREENKEKLEMFFKDFDTSKFSEFYKWSRKPVLGHGDYRPSNLMHRIQEDGTVEIRILDLQTLQRASPIVDLLYFIFFGSDEQFRAKYYEKLIDYYYTKLHAAMTRLHLKPEEIYSRQDFDYELKQKLKFGLVLAVFSLPVITMAAEDAPQLSDDFNLASLSIEKTNDLYEERLNGVVDDFVKYGILK